jgi:hypothetical protein
MFNRLTTFQMELTEMTKSGGGPPHSRTLPRHSMSQTALRVLDCASSLALLTG